MLYRFRSIEPRIHSTAFIAPSAEIIGDVVIGEDTSIWFQCLVRGDVNYIRIGDRCNIQDKTLIHVARDEFPVTIGNNVSIGHSVTLHGCVLKDHSFVGMGSTVMDGVEIGEYSFVGAGSLVTPGKKIPPGMLLMGRPAKILREINENERMIIERTYKNYQKYKENYRNPEMFQKMDD
ncbi:MAG: gamma carbonic anhydrase family protein [Leptospiraceae bacterium]|nr:gamma carbonic anhydrase family protein [Leptospiraceae bacterium]MCP5512135.1 gamma carbonic anhydrase family protein [Leptospiraceae bacterium]